MGFLDKAAGFITRAADAWRAARSPARARSAGERMMGRMIGNVGYSNWAGQWSQDRRGQGGHFRHWVFIAISAIQDKISSLSPDIAEITVEEVPGELAVRKSVLLQKRYAKSGHVIKPHESVDPVGHNHPLRKLFDAPNPWYTSGMLWKQLVLYYELTGNSYLWVQPNEDTGYPETLWCLPAHWVWRTKIGELGVEYYEVRPIMGGGGTFKIPGDEIIHWARPNPLHIIDGWATLSAISEWVDTDESIQQARYWQFKNGCF